MGININLEKCNFNELVNNLMTQRNIKDQKMLEKILLAFGEKTGDIYYLLNNEKWEDYNSYYNVATFIDKYFGIEDSFDIICDLTKDAICNQGIYEVAECLGIQLYNDYDD